MNNSTVDKFRPVPFYFINTTDEDVLTQDAVFDSMRKLKASGFGGGIVFNKPPDGFREEEFLGEKWFNTLRHFAEAGRALDLQIWINDGFDYPPGDAGGRIKKINPGLKQKNFVRAADGKITIEDAEWGFPAFEEPESSRLFIELVYEEHKKYLGEYFGNGITGFFSDADCRRFGPLAGDELNKRKEYFPASDKFLDIFKDKYGYKLDMEHVISGTNEAHSGDYWSLVSELYTQWFKHNYDWCRKNGLKYSFHTSDTGPYTVKECKRSSIFTEGRYHDLNKYCDYPATDHELLSLDGGKHFDGRYFIPKAVWGGSADFVKDPGFYDCSKDIRAKYASSVAFLNDRSGALCEAFAATNWGADLEELRKIAAWQIMQGINFIVPHAVHHRLHGETKYFAPPDFSGSGSLATGIREFNDWLADMCMAASDGELIAPVAVLDPTRYLWRSESDAHIFFEICKKLDYMPYGYVIVDESSILENPERFKILVNPGLQLPEDFIKCITASGTKIIGYDKLDDLSTMLDCAVSFTGDGRLLYMRRRLADGEEILLAANIDNPHVVKGSLRIGEREESIELFPGEIAVLGGKNESFRKSQPDKKIMELSGEYDVRWGQENIIPLSRWEDEKGILADIRKSGGKRLFFRWKNNEAIPAPFLFVPEKLDAAIWVDGVPVDNGIMVNLFADRYLKFALKKAGNAGPHVIELVSDKDISLLLKNNIYLTGEFSVNLKVSEDFSHLHHSFYNMQLYLPERAEISLSARTEKLKPCSWAEQGHPFYSGAATYCLDLDTDVSFGILMFPGIGSVCSVKLDGKDLGKKIWSPYSFDLPEIKKKCKLEITVWNTLANMLEAYKAPSGILATPFILYNNELSGVF